MEDQNNTGSGAEPANYKVKLMCSYGGKIQSKPRHHQLTYVGGDTKILTVDRNIKFCDVVAKINSLCNCNTQFCLKYQLPGEDLDALVSLIDDDDLDHMMVEYDRIYRILTKPARLRLFLFSLNRPMRSEPDSGCATPGAPFNPDFLFGFDEEYTPNINSTPNSEFDPMTGTIMPGNPRSDQRDGSWNSRDSNVISGGYAYPAPLVYRTPVSAVAYDSHSGGMQRAMPVVNVANREQTVYSFIPVMPSAQLQKIPIGRVHNVAGAESLNPTVTVAATLDREYKVSEHNA